MAALESWWSLKKGDHGLGCCGGTWLAWISENSEYPFLVLTVLSDEADVRG